jgi:hypothetical protein
MQEFLPVGFAQEGLVVPFEVRNDANPNSFLYSIQHSLNVRMHLQVHYVRPAPRVLRLDPLQIMANTETQISLYIEYLAPVSSASQVRSPPQACKTI